MSHARFAADDAGVVDLTAQAPITGAYEGVDPMGLFWSRAVVPKEELPAGVSLPADLTTAILVAEREGAAPVVHSIARAFSAESVRVDDVREKGLVGQWFEPEDDGPHPALLVLGGSDGGLYWSREMAGLLASHGFASLALAYFAADGLPPTLDRIPLEYFGKALDWIEAQTGVAADRIGVVGVSRGGELALLLGATFPSIKAVVAHVPSGIVWPAYPATGHGAWTWKGDEVPYAGMAHAQWDQALARGLVRADSFDWYLVPLMDAAYAHAKGIAVEEINGPILMISGEDDGLWPSTELAEFAVRRAKGMRFTHRVEHLRYPGTGHSLGWPNVPTTMTKYKHPTSGEGHRFGRYGCGYGIPAAGFVGEDVGVPESRIGRPARGCELNESKALKMRWRDSTCRGVVDVEMGHYFCRHRLACRRARLRRDRGRRGRHCQNPVRLVRDSGADLCGAGNARCGRGEENDRLTAIGR